MRRRRVELANGRCRALEAAGGANSRRGWVRARRWSLEALRAREIDWSRSSWWR